MSKYKGEHIHIDTISQLHKVLNLPKCQHPLISIIKFETCPPILESGIHYSTDLYSISLKKNVTGKLKYGQQPYDFDEGLLSFIAPKQVVKSESNDGLEANGWWLLFHPDLIRKHPLGKTIKEYGFFSYAVNEALFLSDKEQKMLSSIFENIEQEYYTNIDQFSQDVIVSQIELLLNYANRFYNRQFITRKISNNDILTQLDTLLDEYFNSDKIQEQGLPSVHFFSDRLNVSANYLSDILRNLTGQTTQQHIHEKLIDIAKEKLSTTNLSVSEIAYRLGFEHSQSFSKLFKNKTNQSPLEFRAGFN